MSEARNSSPDAGHYNANYGNFATELYSAIRREAFGEDMGQNSWHTAEEQDRFLDRLSLGPGKTLLDVACGAGGPVLRIATKTGCSVTGIDIHEQAIAAARSLSATQPGTACAEFLVADAAATLPFPDEHSHAITCIDAINHLADREAVIRDWARILQPGGRLLFTNSTVITGPISKEEIAARSTAGFFLFVPPGYDQQVIEQSGLTLLVSEDVTDNTALIAQKRHLARASREQALREIEGSSGYEQQQVFLEVAARLAEERRLSRFLYVAEKSV